MRQCRPARGFTLLELLVVLFVIMLLTSMATLNVGSGAADRLLEDQLRQLQSMLAYAADEAQMSGRDYGLLLHKVDIDGENVVRYGWRERRPEGWRQAQSVSAVFDELDFSPRMDVSLQLDDGLKVEVGPLDDPLGASPQVVFYASGEVLAGALDVRRRQDGELLWRLEWDLLGRSRLLPRGEPAEGDDTGD